MGDITSGISSGLGDVLSNIGNFASNVGGDISSGIGDIFGGAPAVDPSLSPTSIAPTAGSDAANLTGPLSGFGPDSVTPSTVAGTFGDISGLGDVVSQMPPVTDPSLSFTAGLTPGQGQAFIGMEQPSTGAAPSVAATPSGAGATLPMDTVPPQPPATALTATSAPVPPTSGAVPTGGGVGGGGGATAQTGTLSGAGGTGADTGTSGIDTGLMETPPKDPSQGGILNWLSNQLTGPGSLKSDLQMLAALGGLGMSAFKPNAIPGAGQTLSPSGTSTGQAVSTAQQQQQLAAQEAATQAQQQQIAQQNQAISATQTSAAAPLMATGQQQVAAAASGQLLPAQQAQVAAALQANQEQIRAKYANLGLSGSTMEQSDLNQANLQSQALIASLLNQNQTQGLTTITGAENLLAGGGTSLAGASGDINTAVNALNSSVSALGDSGKTYMAILQQQLAQDQELQKALGQMAQSLGTSTALSQFGNAASTAGATA